MILIIELVFSSRVKCIISRPGDNQKLANSIPTSMSVQAFGAKSTLSSAAQNQQLTNSKTAKSMTGIDSLNIASRAARDMNSPSNAQSLESLTSNGDEINSTITLLNSKLTNLELNVSSNIASNTRLLMPAF